MEHVVSKNNWTKIFLNCCGWVENSVRSVEKIESDCLEKDVITDNTAEKFIINIENDLISSESDCDEDNSGSDGMSDVEDVE